MNQIITNKIALTTGLLVGGLSLFWSILVALILGKSIMDFSPWIRTPITEYRIEISDIIANTIFIVIASLVGYILGYIFTLLQNRNHQKT